MIAEKRKEKKEKKKKVGPSHNWMSEIVNMRGKKKLFD